VGAIIARLDRGRLLTVVSFFLLVATPSGLAPFALPGADPLFGAIWLGATAAIVMTHEVISLRDLRAALASAGAGAVLMVAAGSAVHSLLPVFPPVMVSQAAFGALWLVGARTLGRLIVRHVVEQVGWRRTGMMTLGTGVATFLMLAPVAGLLRPSTPLSVRLGWFLGEEDNAHFMGIAREILTLGPSGGRLSEEVGTGLVSTAILALKALRLVDGDPRLTAITVMTLSVALLIVMLGCGLLLLQLAVARPVTRPNVVSLVLLGAASWGAATVGLAVAVALPMQTGFLSFMWAMGWLTVGVSVTPLLPATVTRAERFGVLLHALASLLMLVRSWAFLIGGLVPLLLVLGLLGWPRLWALARSRWYAAAGVLGAIILAIVALFQQGLFLHVVRLGREALLVQASHIYYDLRLFRVLVVAFLASVVLAVLRMRKGRRDAVRLILIIGPTAGVGLSWIGLWILQQLLTDGEIRYAGIKLAYGVVAIASLITLSVLVGLLVQEHWLAQAGLIGLLAVVLIGSSTVAVAENWSSRINRTEQPHAVSVVRAIEQSSPDLPLRCLPRPGTAATPGSRIAAYFCVRWIEDAFNEDRFGGYRFEFLGAEGPTFGPEIEAARASGRYDFARVVLMERGWFGWDGN
jgi:hypothetical protein